MSTPNENSSIKKDKSPEDKTNSNNPWFKKNLISTAFNASTGSSATSSIKSDLTDSSPNNVKQSTSAAGDVSNSAASSSPSSRASSVHTHSTASTPAAPEFTRESKRHSVGSVHHYHGQSTSQSTSSKAQHRCDYPGSPGLHSYDQPWNREKQPEVSDLEYIQRMESFFSNGWNKIMKQANNTSIPERPIIHENSTTA